MTKKETLLIILGIIFISFNLRAPITAVGSVVEMIQEEYLLSSGKAGLMTTLPLIAFALVSPFVAKISHRWGYGKTMAGGLGFIFLGLVIRSYTNLSGLFIGTALLGVGIALGNVLVPSIIKLKFPSKVGHVTSVYTSSMIIFAALGAGVSLPLAKGLNLGWRHALAHWLILTFTTFIIWIPQIKEKGNQQNPQGNSFGSNVHPSSQSIWASSLAWSVTLFMGIQSFIFYSLVAWLPTIILSKGMPDSFSATMALTFQLAGIPAALIIPILCDKFKNQRGLVLVISFIYLSGLVLLLMCQTEFAITIAVLLSASGMGGIISLSIAFLSLRSPNSKRASELSGMAQSAGYLLAAFGPILMGMIYDSFQSWTLPLIIFNILIFFLAVSGWHAGNNLVIQE